MAAWFLHTVPTMPSISSSEVLRFLLYTKLYIPPNPDQPTHKKSLTKSLLRAHSIQFNQKVAFILRRRIFSLESPASHACIKSKGTSCKHVRRVIIQTLRGRGAIGVSRSSTSTPSPPPRILFCEDEIEEWAAQNVREIDVYPLSPLFSGIYFVVQHLSVRCAVLCVPCGFAHANCTGRA